MPNTNVEDEELRAEIDEQLNILGESDDVSGVAKNLMELIAARERKAVEEAELRGVKFAILIIDLLHIEDNDADNDKVYKHVKNTIRIRFEGKTGIDPAPNYPIEAREAELTSNDFQEVQAAYEEWKRL